MNKNELVKLLIEMDACTAGINAVRRSNLNDAHKILGKMIERVKEIENIQGGRTRIYMIPHRALSTPSHLQWFAEEANVLLNPRSGRPYRETLAGVRKAGERLLTNKNLFKNLRNSIFNRKIKDLKREITTAKNCCADCQSRVPSLNQELRSVLARQERK